MSCLMVTRDRKALARRALDCLAAQTWPDLELVVVDDGDEDYGALLDEHRARFASIRYVRLRPDPGRKLGALRNLALDEARGELCVQWDDDEWYHPRRIEAQVAALDERDAIAVVLHTTLMHVNLAPFDRRLFRGSCTGGTPGTILHRRTDVRYPNLGRAEDTKFLRALGRRGRVVKLGRGASHLFIRCFHGTNTWDAAHFQERLRRTPADWVQWIKAAWIHRDLTRHAAFALDAREEDTLRRFLDDSRRLELLAA